MSGILKWFSPVIALMVFAMVSGPALKADDAAAPASQPSASGSITVTVLGPDGQPAPKAKINLYATKKKSEDAKPKKSGKMLQTGKADDDGKFTFQNLASADYAITVSLKSVGKGTDIASVTDAAPNATVTITLAAADATPPAAATAPSAGAAQ